MPVPKLRQALTVMLLGAFVLVFRECPARIGAQTTDETVVVKRVAFHSGELIRAHRGTKRGGNRVLLWACPEPKDQISQAGDLFVSKFGKALNEELGKNWEVVLRWQLNPTPELADLIPQDLRHDDDAMQNARFLPATFFINGKCEPKKHDIRIHLRVMVASGEVLGIAKDRVPRTAEFEQALSKTVDSVFPWSRPILTVPEGERALRVYRAGRGGIGIPRCVECPGIHIGGGKFGPDVAFIEVTVALDGRARDTKVINAIRPGSEKHVMAIVNNWRFKPAQAPDGKPVTTRLKLAVDLPKY